MTRVFLLISFLYTLLFNAYSGDSTHYDFELRLANAQLYYSEGNWQKALSIIKKNITKVKYHQGSYDFLAQILKEKEMYSQALKVYYYLIRKSHTNKLLKAGNIYYVDEMIDSINKPSDYSLSLYYIIAETYYNIFEESKLQKDRKDKFLKLSSKYLFITSYYNFLPGQTNLLQGLIAKARKNYKKSVNHLFIAKEIYETENDQEKKDIIKNINYMIADSLVNIGKREWGAFFLRSIYKHGNQNLKEYAGNYLDALNYDKIYFSASFGQGYNSNVFSLPDDMIDTVENNKGYFIYKDFKIDHVIESTKSFTTILNIFWNENIYNNIEHSNSDERSLGGGLSLKYNGLDNKQVGIFYSLNRDYSRNSEDVFNYLQSTHYFLANLLVLGNKWRLNVEIPFLISKYSNSTETVKTYGFGLNYQPLSTKGFSNFNINLSSYLVEELQNIGNSLQYVISISNNMIFTDLTSLYFNIKWTQNRNDEVSKNYIYTLFEIVISHKFNFWKSLSINFSSEYNYYIYEEDSIKVLKGMLYFNIIY